MSDDSPPMDLSAAALVDISSLVLSPASELDLLKKGCFVGGTSGAGGRGGGSHDAVSLALKEMDPPDDRRLLLFVDF